MKSKWWMAGLVVFALAGLWGCTAKKSEPEKAPSTSTPASNVESTGMKMAPVGTEPVNGITQTICPVMGNPINKDIYTDYKGKRVYFCCNACVGTFNKDPEKYMKKMADEGVKLEDAPANTK